MSEYPKMLYGPDNQTKIVQSQEEENKAGGDWSSNPHESFYSQLSDHHTTRTPVNNPNQVQQPDEGLINRVKDAVIKHLEDNGFMRRGPGRPPGSQNQS
jgi:hypothetical protein